MDKNNKPVKPPFKRAAALQIVLTLTIIANLFGASNAIRNFELFLATYPKLNVALGYVYILCALIAVIGAYYLWNLKKNGLYIIIIAFLTIIGLDLYAGISMGQILASAGILVLILASLIPVRKYLS